MKKLLVALVLVLALAVPCMADQTYVKGEYLMLGVDSLEVGTYYIGDRHSFSLGGQLSLFSVLYKGDKLVNLDFGTLTADGMKYPITGGLSVNLFTLAKLCRLMTTAPKNLNLGVCIGKDFDNTWKDSHFWAIYLNRSFAFKQ